MTPTRTLVSTLALTLTLCLVTADSSDVVTLTDTNFDAVIAKEKLVFVKFFAPWCGHCQSMAADFEKSAAALKGVAVLADVDATKEEELAKKFNIEGFPTLKLFADGEEIVDYSGGRDSDSMVRFVERATVPPYEEIDGAAAYSKFVEDNKDKNILVSSELKPADFVKFKKAAYGLRDVMTDSIEFVSVKSAADVSIDGFAAGEVHLLRLELDGSHKALKYDSSADQPLDKFVKSAALPVFQEFTQENAELYTELSEPIVVGFFKDCEGKECKVMEKIAKKKKDNGAVVFAWVNAETLSSFQDYVGLKDAKVPICAYSFESDAKYLLPEGFEFSESAYEAWVDDLIAGKVEAAIKSEEVPDPAENTGPVYKVVGDTFEEVVNDSSKDVVIAQVAEWCGHCAKLKPIYAKVAQVLKDAGVEHIKFCIMDGTENDAPAEYKARGFPTIHFFPAGEEQKGVDFDGDRTSKGIIEWLMKKSSTKFDFDVSTLGEDPEPEEDEEGEEDDYEDENWDDEEYDDEDFEGEEGEDDTDDKDEL
eukprot:GFKZ01002599.1.p1 GENE.GFKZ01002599.1~~GFKZ01002599.1.p1  ORF type:complete len:543 (-),score=145.51 GFKZ01002599.1:1117-2721(-)